MSLKNIGQVIRDFMTHRIILFLGFCMVFIGLYYSKAFVSLFDVGVCGVGLMYLTKRSDILTAFWNRHTIPFILIIGVYIVSAILSEDHSTALHRLKTNNYYLLIPLGISFLQPFTKKFITDVLCVFVVVSTFSAILVSTNYVLNFESLSESYKTGKTIATPILHIRYSYFISLALLVGLSLFLERERLHDFMKKALPFMLAFLFIFLHVLAVRTGLLSFYAGLGFFALVSGKKYVQPKYLVAGSAGLLLILVLAVQYVPSLKNKLQYSRHDIKMFLNDTGHYLYSDNLRLISIKNGLTILESNPMIGTGIGDIDADMKKHYQNLYPEIPPDQQATPINQIVFSLAAFGYVGAILFFLFLFYPLFYKDQIGDTKLLMIYGATIGSFMGDASIELQLGKVAFVTLICLSLWDIGIRKQMTDDRSQQSGERGQTSISQ